MTRPRPHPSPAATPPSSEAGYTLIELLIVLALLGVLSLLLVSGLQFGSRVWETGERQSAALRQIAIAQLRLRHAIGDAYPVISTADPAQPRVAFAGDAHRLTLIAFDPSTGASSRSAVTIDQGDVNGAIALRLTAVPELALDTAGTRAKTEAIVRGIKEIRFSYLADDTPAWLDTWQNQKRLPRLVRVAVSFPDGDRRSWPDLIVAPRIGADVACVFDALSKSCRGR